MTDTESANFVPREREEFAQAQARNSHRSVEEERFIANREIDRLMNG
jgi:hypothetical protein